MAILRKAANPIKSSLKSVASNKWMKKADAKWTYDKAVEDYRKKVQKRWTASVKQQLWGSMWQNELYWAKEWANKAEKRVKQLEKYNTRNKVNNKAISKSLWSVASNKWMKKSDLQWTIKTAKENLSKAKQQQRTYNSSLHKWNEISQQKAALNKQVKTAEKNVKSLEKTAKKRK